MIKLFEKNTVIQVTVILVAALLVWHKGYATPQPMTADGHFAPLYHLLCHLHLSQPLATTIALLLSLLGGFFLNLTLSHAGLAAQNSLMPTLMFVLAIGAVSPTLSPALLAGLVAIAFVSMLMLHSTLLTVSSDKIFGAAALIGIASLLYLPALTLILSYALIAINYRLYGWRDWMVFLLGLLAPYIPLWIILFLTDHLADSFALMVTDLGSVGLSIGTFTPLQAAANIALLAAFAVSLFIVWRHMGEHTVVWQKNATTVLLVAFAAIASLPFSKVFPVGLELLAIPFAFCLSHRLSLHQHHPSLVTHHSSLISHHSSRSSWRTRTYDFLFLTTILAAIAC